MRETYRIPAWEEPMLREIAEARYSAAREEALQRYITERERRRRHARTRDSRDKERRTLVGAHVPREQAYMVAKMAEAKGMSVTAFVKQAVFQAAREAQAEADRGAEPPWVRAIERGTM
ncbi:MAG: hypothetical protein K2K53_12020 [Oscillospiraceae bacterium]|nr:hypothetical protein [Oscillospiraceae bacterium]